MNPSWRSDVYRVLEGVPFAYCIHDKDIDSETKDRKVHVHFLVVLPANTTDKYITKVFNEGLSLPGKTAFIQARPALTVRGAYDYLIHKTESAIVSGKYQYPEVDRVCGNNFDIGLFEQVSLEEKKSFRNELVFYIHEQNFTTFRSFMNLGLLHYKDQQELFLEVVASYSGFFTNLIKGNYLYAEQMRINDQTNH